MIYNKVLKNISVSMRHLYRYKNPGSIFLIAAGIVLLQGCSLIKEITAQSFNDFGKNNGMEKALDNIALKQIEEYKKTGKVSSTLDRNVSCYQTYSEISSTSDVVTNFAIRKPCPLEWDVDSVTTGMSRIYLGGKTTEGNPHIVEVRCIADSAVYGDRFKDESFVPRLVQRKFPECPRGSRGQTIFPEYRDHSMPQKTLPLREEASTMEELDRISSRQVEEFIKTGKYSSVLSFNSPCGRYISTISQSGTMVINWIAVGLGCNDDGPPPKDRTFGTYMSVVFADEDQKKRTVALSRIICVDLELDDVGQNPPSIRKGAFACGGAEPGKGELPNAIENRNRRRRPVFKQQYPPIPMR